MAGSIARYHCNYCQEDIAGIRVTCAECADFDLCLQCFSCGAEIGKHKNNHKYQLIDCGNLPIFKPPNAWKAKEEVMLLESVEQYGFGNWEDVSENLEKRLTEDVCEHYNDMYIVGSIGKATWSTDNKLQIKDHTGPEAGPLSPSLTTPLPPLELSAQEQQELGYMPHRDDFEREYDNDAESLACYLIINNEDEDVDIALKVAHVDMYSRRLRERLRRKRVAREYNLVSQFFNSSSTTAKQKMPSAKKKPTKDDKDLQEKMLVFAQFHTTSEHEQIFENIQKEKDLKNRIKELSRFRRNGLTKLEDGRAFDLSRYRREKRKENKKKSGSSVSSVHRRPSTASKKLEEKSGDSMQDEQQGEDDPKEEPDDVDITTLPGFKLLSDNEKKLCTSIALKPSYYITLKTVLLKDHLLRKQGQSPKPRYPAGLDKSHRRKIINLLVNSGWITAT